MSNNINSQIAKGAIWMVLLRLAVKGLGLISTLILARLLAPDDFGIMALSFSIYTMIELIREFGFDTVLIQKQRQDPDLYNSAFTLQVMFSSVACILMISLSGLLTEFYGDPRLQHALYLMAGIVFITGLTNIGIVKFRKEMTFNKEFKYQVTVKLSGFLVTIPLAWYLKNYWALLIGTFVSNASAVLLSYIMVSYRPKLNFSKVKEIMSFSSWLFLNNILFFLNHHSQNFVLGKTTNSSGVGVFAIASEIATLTTQELVAPINKAAFSGYSKLKDNLNKLKESYLKVLSSIALMAIPSAVGIASVAETFVPVMLGEQWLATIPLIQIIALASVLSSINTNSAYVYLVLAKQKITTYLMVFRLSIFLPLLTYLSFQYGVQGAALAILITSSITFPVNQIIIKKHLGVLFSELLAIIYRPLISATIMALIILLLRQQLELQPILQLFIEILVGIICYIGVNLLLWLLARKPASAESNFINLIQSRLNKKVKS